ncbi:MAG: N-acetylmuramoyl-L-alanine amidase [Chitinophagaceae bacterium]|nr:N-acetylmuramoyl-L-alanine amidase [Chitinophagaceae bacterium]
MLKRFLVFFIYFSLSFSLFSLAADPTKKAQKEQLKTIVIDAGHGLPNSNAEGKYSYESALTLAIGLKIGQRLKEVLPECNILYTRTDENLPNGLTDKDKANRYRAQFANENKGDLFISIHVNSMEERYERRVEGHRQETYYVSVGKGRKKKKVARTRTVPIYKSYKLPCNRQGTETYIWAINKNDQKMQSIGTREEDGDITGEGGDSTINFYDSPEAKILASLRTKQFFDKSLMIANLVEDEFKKVGRPSFGVKQRNNQGIWVLQATNMPSILIETGFICNEAEEDYLNSEKGQNEMSYAVMRAVLRYKQSLESGIHKLDTIPTSK